MKAFSLCVTGQRPCQQPVWSRLLALFGLVLLVSVQALAQRPTGTPAKPAAPTRRAAATAPPDTSRLAVSGTSDSLKVGVPQRKGDIETTITYKAKDSIRFNIQERVADLYRDANVTYGQEMSLDAARITVRYGENLVTSEGEADSTGRIRGKPLFKKGAEQYQAGRIAYNFKTKRGRITDVVTNEGEGFMHAEVVKRNERNEIFGRNGRYTTCNLEHPHFYINASKMKVVPGQLVASGPFNLVIGDIPTPLGFLFGYFPTPRKGRASGVIIPTFGQAADRGFFLRNGGYYFVPNEYIGVRLTGDIYAGNADTFGGWNGTAEVSYRKRYAYDGRFSFQYTQRPATLILSRSAADTNPNTITTYTPKTFWLSWSHNPVQRPGGGRFMASVSTGSSTYNRQNSLDARNYLSPSFNSTIGYSKVLRNLPINYAVQANSTVNTQTQDITFTLPNVSVGVSRQYFYNLLGLAPRGRWYEQLSMGYEFRGENSFSSTVTPRTLDSGIPVLGGTTTATKIPIQLSTLGPLLRNNQLSMNHSFNLALGSYQVLKHINVTPGISYGATSYTKQLNYSYVPEAGAVRIDTLSGFNWVQSVSGSLSAQTNLYGTFNINKGQVQAIRHRMAPSLAYSWSPNYNTSFFDYNQRVELGNLANPNGVLYGSRYFSRYQGLGGNVPASGQTSALSFGLQNQVEMKMRNKADTTGTQEFKKVSLIDDFSFTSGYNFAADEFKLQALNGTLRTQIAQKLSFLMAGTFDFYQRDTAGARIDYYLWEKNRFSEVNQGSRLMTLQSASIQLNYQFDSNQRKGQPANRQQRVAPANTPDLGLPNRPDPYADYVDFSIPWTLTTALTAGYQKPLPTAAQRAWSAVSLSASGQVKLTDKMRFGYSTGYDFVNQQVSFTSLDFYRDLHCWQISGNWWPFGVRQGFNVTIAAKSSLLQDLKLNRNRTFLNR